uniref:C-type lectin domain-containing protein n=1 Tax=Oncorhynchus kisutch TaxID=8019 RepID=A0A8C7MIU4_ONCKI
KLQSLSILPSSLPHQFHFVNLKKTWTEAQSFCRQNYTDLATIYEDMADMKKLKNTEASTALIGLYNNLWNWSLGNTELEGNGFWDDHHPKNDPNTEFCVYMMLNMTWRSDNCNSTWHFVCYNMTNKYIVIDHFKTWSEAQSYCREKHTDLASVRNTTEMESIKTKKASTPFVWLGLRYTCTLDFWFWVNGEESCYHNWAVGEGYNTIKEQCGNTGAIQRDGEQWVGKSETERFNFICSNSTGEI